MSEKGFEITRPRIIAGIIFFAIAGLMAYISIKTVLFSTPEQGQGPMLVLFCGIGAVFLICGIYMFACRYVIKKSIITFFVGIAATIVFSIIVIYMNNH